MRPLLQGKDQEECHVLLLDTKHQLLTSELVTVGLVDRAHLHAREVFRSAIREGASRVIRVHNHPSGDPTPSAQDSQALLTGRVRVSGMQLINPAMRDGRA